MFGMFRRRDELTRAMDGALPGVPAGTFERLAAFVQMHARRVELSPQEKAALVQWTARPPSWTNPLPVVRGLDGSSALLRSHEPAEPVNGDVPPGFLSGAQPDRLTGGPAW